MAILRRAAGELASRDAGIVIWNPRNPVESQRATAGVLSRGSGAHDERDHRCHRVLRYPVWRMWIRFFEPEAASGSTCSWRRSTDSVSHTTTSCCKMYLRYFCASKELVSSNRDDRADHSLRWRPRASLMSCIVCLLCVNDATWSWFQAQGLRFIDWCCNYRAESAKVHASPLAFGTRPSTRLEH